MVSGLRDDKRMSHWVYEESDVFESDFALTSQLFDEGDVHFLDFDERKVFLEFLRHSIVGRF